MHGRMYQRLAWSLALTVTCGLSTAGRGQQIESFGPGYAGPQAQQVSTTMEAAPGGDVAARLADVENQLKDMKDKEAAAKKKAQGAPTAVVGGMIQMDWATFNQDPVSKSQFGDVQNGFEFRRARIKVAGEGFGIMDYQIEMDFAQLLSGTGITYGKTATPTFVAYQDQVSFKDCFIGIHELPLIGNVKVGHFKEPFGLEQLTSDRYITFMERSMADEGALVPGRQNGVMAYGWTEAEYATYALGVFRTNDQAPPDYIIQGDKGNTSVTGRVTWLPWYDECTEGRGLLHVGMAGSYRDMGTQPDGILGLNTFSMSARPEAHLAPKVDSLSSLTNVVDYKLLGLEMAYVYGPFSVQTEYMRAQLDIAANPKDGFLNGGYAYVSYFLTGENRVYNKKAGCFDRVRPYENFFRVRDEDCNIQTGLGAWEVGYRYSWLDLNDFTVGLKGGIATDHTFGLNWYLNPNMRIMWNYVHSIDVPQSGVIAGTAGKPSWLDTVEMRCAIDF